MQDKTTLGISDTFREYIEALVEEVVINGEPFEVQKKWLRKNSEAEGLSYETIESNLNDLFEAIKEYERHESKFVEHSVRALAKECYLSEALVNKLIGNAATIRRQKAAAERREREDRERKAQEEAERKAREEQDRIAREKAQWQKKLEAERKAKEEAERLAHAEKQAREAAERKAREERERKVREEAERKAREEAERLALAAEQARKEAERKAREEREHRAREEAERIAREREAEKAKREDTEVQRKENLEKRLQENYKKLQELENRANAIIDSANKEKEEKLKTLGLLNELKNQLQIYSNNLKNQSTPIINTANLGWSAMFVEQLRQAYCRKDLVFLDNAFSPNAQITTGAFEKSSNNLRYRTQGKQQYMANLKYIFGNNKTIDVKFWSDNLTGLLYASADGRCQVLRWLQTWCSDNYSDTGYLFLVLFADQNGPKVYVRAWQPQFVNGRHITLQELYGINNVTGLI
jgi:hypothetical protein